VASSPAPEADATTPADAFVAGRRVERLGNVSHPTVAFYPAPDAPSGRPTVLVCPGGGYWILAMDLEGREVCDWLNSIGINAALLKYRVPDSTPPNYVMAAGEDPDHSATGKFSRPLQDAERALGLLRARSNELRIDPHRIGILGFSAGGHLAALMCRQSQTRAYPAVDAADRESCRPDAALLIYPAYLARRSGALNAEFSGPLAGNPPTFIVMAEDDPIWVGNALYYYLALAAAKVPAELHVYPSGGHGFGLRPAGEATTWPRRADEWLRQLGWLAPPAGQN
jgi:acetyl esterase/lipase